MVSMFCLQLIPKWPKLIFSAALNHQDLLNAERKKEIQLKNWQITALLYTQKKKEDPLRM